MVSDLRKKTNHVLVNFLFFLLAISLGLNNIVVGYKFFGLFSFDRLFQLLFFFAFFKLFISNLRDHSFLLIIKLILSLLILILLKYLSLTFQGQLITVNEFIRNTFRVLMYGAFTSLTYSLFKFDLKKVNFIVFLYLLAFSLAFFQNPLTPLTDLAHNIRINYFKMNMLDLDARIYDMFLKDKARTFLRVTGPYGQPVTLSYALVTCSVMLTYLYQSTRKYIHVYLLIFTYIVSVMSLTRSAVLAISLLLFFNIKASKVSIFFIVTLTGFLILIYLEDFKFLSEFSRVISTDKSSNGKIYLILTGFLTLLLNPFGVTDNNYREIKEYVYSFTQNSEVLEYTSHNGIINLGFEYTTLVYVPFFYVTYSLIKKTKILTSEKQKFWLIAFLAYFIQQSFHNNGLFYVDFNVLLILSLFLYDLKNSKNQSE